MVFPAPGPGEQAPTPLCRPASELPLGVCQLGLCLLVLAPQAYRTKEIQTNAEEDLKGNF